MKPLKIASIVYWLGMWLTILLRMFSGNGTGGFFLQVLMILIWMAGASGAVVFGLYHLVLYCSGRFGKFVILTVWMLTPILFITLVMEGLFHVISGHMHGLESTRREWFFLVASSCSWSLLTYWIFVRNRLPFFQKNK